MNKMLTLLLVALMAPAGTALARDCGKRNKCEKRCEKQCKKRCEKDCRKRCCKDRCR